MEISPPLPSHPFISRLSELKSKQETVKEFEWVAKTHTHTRKSMKNVQAHVLVHETEREQHGPLVVTLALQCPT